jgi:hypothetical protein
MKDSARLPATVRVGGLERAALLRALRGLGVLLNRAAEMLFEDPRFEPDLRERVVEIQAWSGAELGFSEGARYGELALRARERGFQECPLELGPHLRLQFLAQLDAPSAGDAVGQRAPPGALTIASAAVDDSERTPRGFYLIRRDGRLWLRGYWGSPEHVWHPEDVLIFCRSAAR